MKHDKVIMLLKEKNTGAEESKDNAMILNLSYQNIFTIKVRILSSAGAGLKVFCERLGLCI